MEENKKMDREEKRGIFLGIIGVLTLIVAIIGASFAYFSVNAKSSDDAVTVQAASVQIVYEDGQDLMLNNIIPSTKAVALESQRRALAGEKYDAGEGNMVNYELCRDDKNYAVCSIYDFSLTNNGDNPVDVSMKVVPVELEENEVAFHNLKFTLYDITDVTESTPAAQQNGTEVYEGTFDYSEFGLLSSDISEIMTLAGNGANKKYRMFIWLNETEDSQDFEQGAIFKGGVHIDVEGAANITGDASKTLG